MVHMQGSWHVCEDIGNDMSVALDHQLNFCAPTIRAQHPPVPTTSLITLLVENESKCFELYADDASPVKPDPMSLVHEWTSTDRTSFSESRDLIYCTVDLLSPRLQANLDLAYRKHGS